MSNGSNLEKTRAVTVLQYSGTHTNMGGLEYHVLTMCEKLGRDRIRLLFASREDSHPEFFGWAGRLGIPVLTFPPAKEDKVAFLRRALWLARVIRQERVDVLHIHAVGLSGLPAYLAAWLARVPSLVVTHHAWYDGKPEGWFQRLGVWFERRIADRVIAFHSGMVSDLKALGIKADRLLTVPHGVDLSRFLFRDNESVTEPGIFRVATVARMVEGKGQEEIVRAVHKLAQQHPQLRLLLIGDGPTRPRIEALVQELGLEDIVEIAGYVANDEVPAMGSKAQVMALPTYYEGETFGIVLIEGMALGMATIGSRYVAIPDIIVEGETGLLVEPRDVDGLAQAIEKLVRSPELAAEMGRKGRRRAEENFSAEALGRTMTQLYLSSRSRRKQNAPETARSTTSSDAPAVAGH
jgi:glycosyltransferase involved in cell wall biosynthesis